MAKKKAIRAKAIATEIPQGMNRTEELFAKELNHQRRWGRVAYYAFEPVKLRLAKATFYTPDFLTVDHDGFIVFWEVKRMKKNRDGEIVWTSWRDDARVKFKMAAQLFPFFQFQAAVFDGDNWHYETVR